MALHVVAAAIINERDQLLIALRPDHLDQGGLWEFPGGKCEPGEQAESALRRELQEELDITPTKFEPLIKVRHHYPDKEVLLDVWLVTDFNGTPHGKEGQQVRWVNRGQLQDYTFPEANLPVLKALGLPARCLITGKFSNQEDFIHRLTVSLDRGIRLVIMRAKMLDKEETQHLAREAKLLCEKQGARLMINCPLHWFEEGVADGLHLTSEELANCVELNPSVAISASCHDLAQLKKAEQLGAAFALLSPVKETVSHPGVPGIGWQQFAELVEEVSIPVYALGGMKASDLPDAKIHGAQGVAAISEFWGG